MPPKLTSLTIGVSPLTADVVCVTAVRQQVSVRHFSGQIVERVIRAYFSLSSESRATFTETPSTLAWVLGGPRSTRVL